MKTDTANLPRPRCMRVVWAPGIQYEGETLEAMAAREARMREADRAAAAEEARLWRWKLTPWWDLP